LILFSALALLSGCTRISVAPDCPADLEVGESVTIKANETNPGAIPTYKWQVSPADAGTFDPTDAAETSFTAAKPGDATVRLTAADGLFQVIEECQITVAEAGDVVVSLSVTPDPPVLGESAMVVCRSIGETVAATRILEQTGDVTVQFTLETEGVGTFTPTEDAVLEFTCTGQSAGGRDSEPAVLTVTVGSPDDTTDNANDNGGRRPPGRG
jgi:hypothetical protein